MHLAQHGSNMWLCLKLSAQLACCLAAVLRLVRQVGVAALAHSAFHRGMLVVLLPLKILSSCTTAAGLEGLADPTLLRNPS